MKPIIKAVLIIACLVLMCFMALQHQGMWATVCLLFAIGVAVFFDTDWQR